MITRADIVERVREWGLAEQVVEKDYVLGWLLWGIGSDPALGEHWIFKGGTCLKKCYIETYRFSEDLDFTVLPGGPVTPDAVMPLLQRVLDRASQESGVDFGVAPPRFQMRLSGRMAEGRIYYRGPRQTRTPGSVKLDLSVDEVVVRPPVLRSIAHPYPDPLPAPGHVRCYAFEELFAEKLRAMGQRGRPRDLYDIVNLYRRNNPQLHAGLIADTLVEKCRGKSVMVPTFESVIGAPRRSELESEWQNMLGYQLPALPPLEQFVAELVDLFAWLRSEIEFRALPAIAVSADEDETWSPPPTAVTWHERVPVEPIRFAATNHLCVVLTYEGTVRLIEPYALRRTRAGDLLLHTLDANDRQQRIYRFDWMEHAEVTSRAFRPVYAIEFSSSGPLASPALPEEC